VINFEFDTANLTRFAEKLPEMLSPAAITSRVIVIANRAGVALKEAAVRACMEEIYDQPESESYTRTQALLNAHRLYIEDGGMIQVVDIDPDATPEESRGLGDSAFRERWVSGGRETVLDYAVPVHEGYVQWIYGHNTGEFHPGRFWFDRTVEEAGPVIVNFIQLAFFEIIEEIMNGATI